MVEDRGKTLKGPGNVSKMGAKCYKMGEGCDKMGEKHRIMG